MKLRSEILEILYKEKSQWPIQAVCYQTLPCDFGKWTHNGSSGNYGRKSYKGKDLIYKC